MIDWKTVFIRATTKYENSRMGYNECIVEEAQKYVLRSIERQGVQIQELNHQYLHNVKVFEDEISRLKRYLKCSGPHNPTFLTNGSCPKCGWLEFEFHGVKK